MSLSLRIGCKDHDISVHGMRFAKCHKKSKESDKYSLTDSKQEASLYLPRSSSPCVVRSRQQGKYRPKGGLNYMDIIGFLKLFFSLTNRDYDTGKFYLFKPVGKYNSYPYFPVMWISPIDAIGIALKK